MGGAGETTIKRDEKKGVCVKTTPKVPNPPVMISRRGVVTKPKGEKFEKKVKFSIVDLCHRWR